MSEEKSDSKSDDLYSDKSDELSDRMLYIKRKNERFALFIGILSQVFWALNTVQLKTYLPNFPEEFSNNSLVFWRSLSIWIIGYLLCKKNNVRIKPLSEIKHKFWFISRSFGNYVGVFLWIKVLIYLRVSTGHAITACFPIVVVFLSVIILHETFYWRYVIGILICIAGSAIILLNEKTGDPNKSEAKKDIILGVCFGIAHLLVDGLSNLGQKVQCKDKLTADEQNYYLGMYNTLPALFFCIIEMHIGFSNIIYVLYAFSNGFCFYIANYLQAKSLEYIALAKFMPITYLCPVFAIILSVVLLSAPLYFTDIIGAALIIGFQIYNMYYPPGRQVSEEEIKDIDKKSGSLVLEYVDENVLQKKEEN